MAPVRRSSSRSNGLMGLLTTAALLAGCAGTSTLLHSSPSLRLGQANDTVRIVETPLKSTVDADVVQVAPAANKQVQIIPAQASPENSAWCEHLRADAAAQAVIMRSPTLSGSVDDDAKASLSLGLSLGGLAKAELTEQAAEVRCRRYLAESGLQKLVFVSPQGLTAAGHKAKLKHIESQRKEIERLVAKSKRLMNEGYMTREYNTSISVVASQILAEAGHSKSQADRRLETSLMPDISAKQYGLALLEAEAELEDINSRMRTLDSMDVTASVGWDDDINEDGLTVDGDSFSGKVSFSLKLGALAPQRFEHEERAKLAKLRAIRDEEGGALWQVSLLRRVHERALDGLALQSKELDAAIRKAENLAKTLASVSAPEFEPPLIQAKLQLIKLRADRAAVESSIAEIRDNMKKLKAS